MIIIQRRLKTDEMMMKMTDITSQLHHHHHLHLHLHLRRGEQHEKDFLLMNNTKIFQVKK